MRGGRGGGGGTFGGDATHVRVGPIAVIAVAVMIVGLVVMPFRYPLATFMVVVVGAALAVFFAMLGASPRAGWAAPLLLLIAYKISRSNA